MEKEQNEGPEYSVYAVKNTRRLMEDRHVVIPNLVSQLKEKGDNHYSYYAIFDGHAGPDAAQFAADTLHQNLVDCSFFKSGNISDAFRFAYATTDFQYTEKSLNDGIKAGCTAVTCLLENRSRLYLAWVGDSVAILSRNGKPCFMTEPHNLERDDEKERVEAMGGTVLYFDTWRVNGTLGVSRAIGDPEYKPYVCADPDIECIELDGSEDFLIIGCDGLWDRMTPEDAIGLIYEHLGTNSHLGVSELVNSTAQILADKSIKEGSSDNVTTIVIFLKDVASIVNSSSSASVCYGMGVNGSNNHKSNGNGNDNGFEYDERLKSTTTITTTATTATNRSNDLIGSEFGEIRGPNENVGEVGSTLNPFADEFQPNVCNSSNNLIGSGDGVGNEPKKDEESHKNEGSDKKGSWMSEFTDDGNNYHQQYQQQQQQHHHQQQQQQQQQHEHDLHDTQVDLLHGGDYPKKSGMFDGLMGNGLSESENLSLGVGVGVGHQHEASNFSSSEYSDNLSSEMIIHEIDENKSDSQQQPSAPELLFIEQRQHEQHEQEPEQSNLLTIETNLISQAETFVGNLTPNEVPSSPVNEKVSSTIENDNECGGFTFDTQSSATSATSTASTTTSITPGMGIGLEDVNQYITSVSDGMVSEPYHDGYFANDCVEPQSIIVNRGGDDVISSGPHAIDPYSGKGEDKIEFDSIKGDDDKGEGEVEREGEGEGEGDNGDDDDNDDDDEKKRRRRVEVEEDALNSSTGKINIEDTQSIPLESLNPFDGGNNNGNEFGVDIGPGDESKSSYYTDNPDNSCGLLDFSDDQVNTIMITPNSSGYLLNESKLMEESVTERGLFGVELEQQLSEEKKMDKDEKATDTEMEKEKVEGNKEEEEGEEDGLRVREAEEKTESSSSGIPKEPLVNESDKNGISSQGGESGATTVGIATATAAVAVAVAVTTVGAVGAGVSGVGSKASEPVKKDSSSKTVFSKTPAVKKSTLPATTKTMPSRTTSSTGIGATSTRKPLATGSATTSTASSASSRLTSSIRSTSSSTTSKLSTSRQPTSTFTSTASTSNVKNSSSTSRVGTASTLNKRPTQTSTTTTSGISRVSSLASSRTTTSTSSRLTTSVGATTGTGTSRPLARTTASTTTSMGLASRRTTTTTTTTIGTSSSSSSSSTRAPIRSTLTSRIGSTSTRAPTSSSSTTSSTTTASKPSTISSTSTTKTVAPKRASTGGTSLNRPSPVASSSSSSSSNNRSTASVLNRSLTKSTTSSPSSRPGTSSTLSKASTRPTTASSTLSSSSRLTKSTASTAPSKPTTSTNKVAVPRLGLNKKTPTGSIGGTNEVKKVEETLGGGGGRGGEVSSSASPLINMGSGEEGNSMVPTVDQSEKCPTPVEAVTSSMSSISSMRREKDPNSANSLKDELEAALASPISSEERGVITKEDESSGNL